MTMIMHHHIYKNAGTTIDWILQRNFPGNVLHIEGAHTGARLTPDEVQKAAAPFPSHSAISSHTTPLPGATGVWADCHLTMLRQPVERFYSMYRFDRLRNDDEPASQVAAATDFRGYCEWWLRRNTRLTSNWQVRCCTPQSWERPANNVAPGWKADLTAASRTLESDFVFAGLVEEFDKSMVVLEFLLRKRGIDFDAAYIRQNAARVGRVVDAERGVLEKLGQSLYDNLIEVNTMDSALIDHAKTLLSERFRLIPDGNGALDDFRRRCGALAETADARLVRVPNRSCWIVVKGVRDNRSLEHTRLTAPESQKPRITN